MIEAYHASFTVFCNWLDTRHHFSFAEYYDPNRMHWGNLRVWNDGTIAPHSGFPRHPHRDMEIITYVRSELNEEDETTEIFQISIMPNEIGLPPAWGTMPQLWRRGRSRLMKWRPQLATALLFAMN
ncbi:MAG: pirin family protein, partial [Marinobacter sp.]|nr:pirin family protein [Marinobacter sp.]